MTNHVFTANAALLIMDFQPQILDGLDQRARDEVIAAAKGVSIAARAADVPVIFVAVRYRPGYPDASSDNKRVGLLRSKGMLEEDSPGVELHPDLDRHSRDPVVVKRRVSALAHTDLPPLLRSLGVKQLLLSGVSTSGVVLSTVRAAADEDYRIVVVRDACADPNGALHTTLMDEVFPMQAEVFSSAEFAAALR